MLHELILFGAITGFISGFFGVGGGMVLVPMLIFAGFFMKEAIAISILQMVFSSIFGSFLNSRKALNVFKDGIIIGIGGFIGGLQNSIVLANVSNEFLQYLFIGIVLFAIIRMFNSSISEESEKTNPNKIVLFCIGLFIGLVAMSIGIGGAIMLTPILVGFMKYDLKTAASLGLFFVVFSSLAGFISLSYSGQMLYSEGITVGLASLIGVYFGIKLKNLTNMSSYKKYILSMYMLILVSMIYKTFF